MKINNWSFDVDKVAIVGLTMIEITALFTNPTMWSESLHFASLIAIAGLGGYALRGEVDKRQTK